VAYLALSGRLPFNAPSVPALMAQHVNVAPPALALAAPSTPRPLTAVIDRLLRKNPVERFTSGEELAEAIEGASAPTRAKLPIALRVWTQSQNPMRGLYVAWSGLFTIGFLSQLASGRIGGLFTIAAIGAVPLVPLTVFHLRKTYQA